MKYVKKASIRDYYQSKYITDNKDSILGKCLVISNIKNPESLIPTSATNYTFQSVTKTGNELKNIPLNSYDTVITLDALNYIEDYESAIESIIGITKPGGTILCTFSSFAPTLDSNDGLWGFTEVATRYICDKFFDSKHITYTGYGNVFSGSCYLKKAFLPINSPLQNSIITMNIFHYSLV